MRNGDESKASGIDTPRGRRKRKTAEYKKWRIKGKFKVRGGDGVRMLDMVQDET